MNLLKCQQLSGGTTIVLLQIVSVFYTHLLADKIVLTAMRHYLGMAFSKLIETNFNVSAL